MLTPKFSLKQNIDHVVLCATCPLIHVQSIEYCLEEKEFYFYAKPYYLRLGFNEAFSKVDQVQCQYDIDTGVLRFLLPKDISGQEFTELEFMTKLILTSCDIRPKGNEGHMVEEIDNDHQNVIEEDEDLSLFYTVPVVEHQPKNVEITSKYGFNNEYFGIFSNFPPDYCREILDLSSPESSTLCDRIKWQKECESNDFDWEHYMVDYEDQDENIKHLIALECTLPETRGTLDSDSMIEKTWNEREKEQLVSLKKKSHVIEDAKSVYFGLVDILLAYSYNRRITEMENTVESCWTISKLSSTLSWLINRDSLNETVKHFYTRGLCYPLYRNWDLLTIVQKDTVNLLKSGKRIILRALLEIKDLFDHDECKYILSLLYLDDYCLWIQNASTKRISFLANALEEITIHKSDDFPWAAKISIKDLELNVEK